MQACSLGLEHLGLEAVSRRFLELLISVLKNRTSQSRLGLEDITSRSRDFSLVNMHAMRIYHEENNGPDPQERGCQVRAFTSWCF